jgi:Mitochondrial carrier protein
MHALSLDFFLCIHPSSLLYTMGQSPMDEAWATEGDSSSFPVEAVGDQGNEDEVTALQDFVAGGIAGSASVVVGHPFDTIKVIF